MTEEARAWAKVDATAPASLEAFLRAFPEGKHAAEARLALALHRTLAAIRSGTETPAFVVPFSAFAPRGQEPERPGARRSVLGVLVERTFSGAAMRVFRPLPGEPTVHFDRHGSPIAPTADGSLVAIRTGGLKLRWMGSCCFQCDEGQTMYFGVVENVGLVHLAGAGTVAMPDGTVVRLGHGPRG